MADKIQRVIYRIVVDSSQVAAGVAKARAELAALRGEDKRFTDEHASNANRHSQATDKATEAERKLAAQFQQAGERVRQLDAQYSQSHVNRQRQYDDLTRRAHAAATAPSAPAAAPPPSSAGPGRGGTDRNYHPVLNAILGQLKTCCEHMQRAGDTGQRPDPQRHGRDDAERSETSGAGSRDTAAAKATQRLTEATNAEAQAREKAAKRAQELSDKALADYESLRDAPDHFEQVRRANQMAAETASPEEAQQRRGNIDAANQRAGAPRRKKDDRPALRELADALAQTRLDLADAAGRHGDSDDSDARYEELLDQVESLRAEHDELQEKVRQASRDSSNRFRDKARGPVRAADVAGLQGMGDTFDAGRLAEEEGRRQDDLVHEHDKQVAAARQLQKEVDAVHAEAAKEHAAWEKADREKRRAEAKAEKERQKAEDKAERERQRAEEKQRRAGPASSARGSAASVDRDAIDQQVIDEYKRRYGKADARGKAGALQHPDDFEQELRKRRAAQDGEVRHAEAIERVRNRLLHPGGTTGTPAGRLFPGLDVDYQQAEILRRSIERTLARTGDPKAAARLREIRGLIDEITGEDDEFRRMAEFTHPDPNVRTRAQQRAQDEDNRRIAEEDARGRAQDELIRSNDEETRSVRERAAEKARGEAERLGDERYQRRYDQQQNRRTVPGPNEFILEDPAERAGRRTEQREADQRRARERQEHDEAPLERERFRDIAYPGQDEASRERAVRAGHVDDDNLRRIADEIDRRVSGGEDRDRLEGRMVEALTDLERDIRAREQATEQTRQTRYDTESDTRRRAAPEHQEEEHYQRNRQRIADEAHGRYLDERHKAAEADEKQMHDAYERRRRLRENLERADRVDIDRQAKLRQAAEAKTRQEEDDQQKAYQQRYARQFRPGYRGAAFSTTPADRQRILDAMRAQRDTLAGEENDEVVQRRARRRADAERAALLRRQVSLVRGQGGTGVADDEFHRRLTELNRDRVRATDPDDIRRLDQMVDRLHRARDEAVHLNRILRPSSDPDRGHGMFRGLEVDEDRVERILEAQRQIINNEQDSDRRRQHTAEYERMHNIVDQARRGTGSDRAAPDDEDHRARRRRIGAGLPDVPGNLPNLRDLPDPGRQANPVVRAFQSMGNMRFYTAIIGALFIAIVALVPVIASATAALGGLLAIASAALGAVGGFAIVAVGELKKVTEAIQAVRKSGAPVKKEYQGVVGAFLDLSAAYKSLQIATRGPVLATFQKALEFITEMMPKATPLVEAGAQGINRAITAVDAGLSSESFRNFVTFIAEEGPRAIGVLGTVFRYVGQGIAELSMSFQPFIAFVEQGLVNMAQGFARWAESLAGSQAFKDFLDYAMQVGPQVLTSLSNLLNILIRLGQAFAPVGMVLLDMIDGLSWLLDQANKVNGVLQTLGVIIGGLVVLRLVAAMVVFFGKALMMLGTASQWLANRLWGATAAATGFKLAMRGLAAATIIGLAITAVITAIDLFSAASSKAKKNTDDWKLANQQLAESIVAANGAIDEQTARTAAEALQKSGLLDAGLGAGVSSGDMVKAYLGTDEDFNNMLTKLEKRQLELSSKMSVGVDASGNIVTTGLTEAENAELFATGENINKLKELRGELRGKIEAQRAVAAATKGATDADKAQTVAQESLTAKIQAGLEQTDEEKRIRAAIDAKQAWIDATEDQEDAQRAYTRAVEEYGGESHQRELAAVKTARAEMNLADAQRRAVKAQEALTKAREDAYKKLEEYRDKVRDVPLNEEEAQIGLARAQERYASVMNDPTSSILDRREALVALQRAQNALTDTYEDSEQTRIDSDKAEKKGIEGSDEVQQAINDQKDAILGAQEAQLNYNEEIRKIRYAWEDSKEAVADSLTALDKSKEKLANAWTQSEMLRTSLGLTAEQFTNLKTQMDLIDPEFQMRLSLDTGNVMAQMRTVLIFQQAGKLMAMTPTLTLGKAVEIATKDIDDRLSRDAKYLGSIGSGGLRPDSGGSGIGGSAEGGPVVGEGSATSDSIPALLSHGEHVWTAMETALIGGHQVMETLRDAVKHSKFTKDDVDKFTNGARKQLGFRKGGSVAAHNAYGGFSMPLTHLNARPYATGGSVGDLFTGGLNSAITNSASREYLSSSVSRSGMSTAMGQSFNIGSITINNPVAEPAGDSLYATVKRLAFEYGG